MHVADYLVCPVVTLLALHSCPPPHLVNIISSYYQHPQNGTRRSLRANRGQKMHAFLSQELQMGGLKRRRSNETENSTTVATSVMASNAEPVPSKRPKRTFAANMKVIMDDEVATSPAKKSAKKKAVTNRKARRPPPSRSVAAVAPVVNYPMILEVASLLVEGAITQEEEDILPCFLQMRGLPTVVSAATSDDMLIG